MLRLIPREQCPACATRSRTPRCDLPLDDAPLWPFLEAFYRGRVPRSALAGQRYRIAHCAQCDLLYQLDVPDEAGMALLYGEWLDSDRSLAKKQRAKPELFQRYAREAELITRLFPEQRPDQIRVLELGTGWGYWSRMASAFGYQVTGLELDPRRAAHARSLGVSLASSLQDLAPASYDFIYANQVLEHLAEPAAVLQQLRALLSEPGRLLVRVPDAEGLASQLQQQGWSPEMDAIHPLEHLNGFSRSSLLQLAAQCGLRTARAPVMLNCRSPKHLWRSLQREWCDRYHRPHLLLCKADQ